MNKRSICDYSNTNYGNNSLDATLPNANGNCAFGTDTLTNNTSGDENSSFGFKSLSNNITGCHNAAYGCESLLALVGGSYNTALGCGSGNNILRGHRNVLIGYNSGDYLGTNKSDTLVIANSATDNLIIGDFVQQKIGLCYGNGSITGALSGDVSIDGQSDKTLTVERHLTSHGSNLILSAGGGGIGSVNSDGGDLQFKSGITTGTGSSKIVFSLADNTTASSSTADNTFIDRLIIAPPKKISITKNVAVQNPLFIINVPVGGVAAGTFDLSVSVFTSSNMQTLQDQYMYTISNKAGVMASNFSNFGAITRTTSSTLTLTMVLVAGTNQIIVRPTINVATVAGTLQDSFAYFTIRNNSNSSITLYN